MAQAATALIYPFTFGDRTQSDLLGGKGANLAEMVRMGLPVPPGFTITTEACREYLASSTMSTALLNEVDKALADLENSLGKKFGDPKNPLLVSVRSGAKFSMPGMMETVLNVGMTPEVAEGIAQASGNARFAWDSYRRFVDMFGRIVCDVPPSEFHKVEHKILENHKVSSIAELDVDGLKALAEAFKKVIEVETSQPFPTDPRAHLLSSIEAVFRSWNSERARLYRRRERIPSDLGTAVNIQSMVFGNLDDLSGTGVAFTRDPATGEHGSHDTENTPSGYCQCVVPIFPHTTGTLCPPSSRPCLCRCAQSFPPTPAASGIWRACSPVAAPRADVAARRWRRAMPVRSSHTQIHPSRQDGVKPGRHRPAGDDDAWQQHEDHHQVRQFLQHVVALGFLALGMAEQDVIDDGALDAADVIPGGQQITMQVAAAYRIQHVRHAIDHKQPGKEKMPQPRVGQRVGGGYRHPVRKRHIIGPPCKAGGRAQQAGGVEFITEDARVTGELPVGRGARRNVQQRLRRIRRRRIAPIERGVRVENHQPAHQQHGERDYVGPVHDAHRQRVAVIQVAGCVLAHGYPCNSSYFVAAQLCHLTAA